MANTIISQEEWATKLAARLDKPQNWKDVCDVRYTTNQTTVLPYVSAANEPAVTAAHLTSVADRNTMSKVIPFVSVTMATETLQIISTDTDNVYLDFADQAQSNYATQMQMADLLGKKIGERVETNVLANHAAWTNFGDTGAGVLGLADTQITISATNIDDVVRGIIEQIQTANGFGMYRDNGGFAIWRPADWTALTTFMQANGFTFADEALRDPNGRMGKDTMGLFHYVSTLHASGGHIMAGVRGAQLLGLLSTTFGKVYTVDHPASSTAGFMSGTSVYSRLDYGLKVQTNVAPVIYDVRVN